MWIAIAVPMEEAVPIRHYGPYMTRDEARDACFELSRWFKSVETVELHK